jgi:hypothetical protein
VPCQTQTVAALIIYYWHVVLLSQEREYCARELGHMPEMDHIRSKTFDDAGNKLKIFRIPSNSLPEAV